MITTKQFLGMFVAVALLLAAAIFTQTPQKADSSASRGSEYYATSTALMATDHDLVRTGVVTLGSVVIASSSPTTFTIWNATSTKDLASTTLVSFGAGQPEGTYTFDTILTRGLVIELPTGYDGDAVVTFRP